MVPRDLIVKYYSDDPKVAAEAEFDIDQMFRSMNHPSDGLLTVEEISGEHRPQCYFDLEVGCMCGLDT
jgi:hypothetical protein